MVLKPERRVNNMNQANIMSKSLFMANGFKAGTACQ